MCGFGLTIIPAVFSVHLDDELHPALHTGVKMWLDDILLHSKTRRNTLPLLPKFSMYRLRLAGFSVYFGKSLSGVPWRHGGK